MKSTRKKRSDRTHVVYQLECQGLLYIGITVKSRSTPLRSVWDRWQKHQSRARMEDKAWPLYQAIRKYGADAFTYSVVEVLRGKSLAHSRERELIREIQPQLNLA
jgi:hypothetical protein